MIELNMNWNEAFKILRGFSCNDVYRFWWLIREPSCQRFWLDDADVEPGKGFWSIFTLYVYETPCSLVAHAVVEEEAKNAMIPCRCSSCYTYCYRVVDARAVREKELGYAYEAVNTPYGVIEKRYGLIVSPGKAAVWRLYRVPEEIAPVYTYAMLYAWQVAKRWSSTKLQERS